MGGPPSTEIREASIPLDVANAARSSLFHRDEFWRSYFGDEGWYSITVRRDDGLLTNVVRPIPIGDTGTFDVEPWFGYPRPFSTSRDAGFLTGAFESYARAATELRLVAELFRFEPYPAVDPLTRIPSLRIVAGRHIAYAHLYDNAERFLADFSPACRRMLRAHDDDYKIHVAQTHEDWVEFSRMYADTMQRVGAAQRWYFTAATFIRLIESPLCTLYLARRLDGALVSGMLTMGVAATTSATSYSLMVASYDLPANPGVNDSLMFHAGMDLRRRGFTQLCLGGGRTSALDDSLLRFKRRVTSTIVPVRIGLAVYDDAAYSALCAAAAGHDQTAVVQPSAEVLEALLPYRVRGPLVDPAGAKPDPNTAASRRSG